MQDRRSATRHAATWYDVHSPFSIAAKLLQDDKETTCCLDAGRQWTATCVLQDFYLYQLIGAIYSLAFPLTTESQSLSLNGTY